jgi:glycosyltransferase involved in cell wall biosynthesis
MENVYQYIEPKLGSDICQNLELFAKKPLISIITPTYNIDIKIFELLINSVLKQWYKNWELIIIDDGSANTELLDYLKSLSHPNILVFFNEKNLGISSSTNFGISQAQGEYIGFLDHDDELTPDALYEVVQAINNVDPDIIYSDEDFIQDNNYIRPHFKSDFNETLLLNHYYVTHFLIYKSEIIQRTGTFDSDCDGSQDYDFFLRASDLTKKIHHIPRILYHWRMIPTSTCFYPPAKPEAHHSGKKAIEKTISRRKIDAKVEDGYVIFSYKVRYQIKADPLVSIVIPFKGHEKLSLDCFESILNLSSYKNFNIISVSSGNLSEENFHTLEKLKSLSKRISYFQFKDELHNKSSMNNLATLKAESNTEHMLFLNPNTQIIHEDWIEYLLEYSQQSNIGAVGGKILFPDKTILNAGYILGVNGYFSTPYKGMPSNISGYFSRAQFTHQVMGVSGDCMMVKRELIHKMGGFDATNFPVLNGDVDLCVRLHLQNFKNIFNPSCQVIQLDSEKVNDMETKEKNYFIHNYRNIIDRGDPFYNQNFSKIGECFSL